VLSRGLLSVLSWSPILSSNASRAQGKILVRLWRGLWESTVGWPFAVIARVVPHPSWSALSVNPTEAPGAVLSNFRGSRKIDLTETCEAFRGERCFAPPATMPKAAQGAIRGPALARGTKRGSEQEIRLDRGCTNPARRDQAPPCRSCDRSRPTRGPLEACPPPSAPRAASV
jgi:hypothetical protein